MARRSSADLFAGFAAISAVITLTSSRFSCLKYPWLGWPSSWLAGSERIVRFCRISWCLEAARQVAGVDLYMRAVWAGGSPRSPGSISASAKLARC